MAIMCPACGDVRMIAGRRRDKKDAFSTSQETWIPGEHEVETLGWFQGATNPIPVTTYACPRCGMLRSHVDVSMIPENLRK